MLLSVSVCSAPGDLWLGQHSNLKIYCMLGAPESYTMVCARSLVFMFHTLATSSSIDGDLLILCSGSSNSSTFLEFNLACVLALCGSLSPPPLRHHGRRHHVQAGSAMVTQT